MLWVEEKVRIRTWHAKDNVVAVPAMIPHELATDNQNQNKIVEFIDSLGVS